MINAIIFDFGDVFINLVHDKKHISLKINKIKNLKLG